MTLEFSKTSENNSELTLTFQNYSKLLMMPQIALKYLRAEQKRHKSFSDCFRIPQNVIEQLRAP